MTERARYFDWSNQSIKVPLLPRAQIPAQIPSPSCNFLHLKAANAYRGGTKLMLISVWISTGSPFRV